MAACCAVSHSLSERGIESTSFCGVLVRRAAEHRVDRPRLDDRPAIEHVDALDDLAHDREIVGDEEVAHPELVAQRREEVEDLRLHGDVERRDGLVADEQARLDRQRAGDRDALPLAARQRDGLARGVFGRQSDGAQEIRHLPADATSARLGHEHRLLQRRADRAHRVERRVRILEDDLHAATHRGAVARRELRVVGGVDAVDRDRAGGRRLEPDEAAAERRLARARLADEADALALAHLDRDAGERIDARAGP